jgi:hypothetical protein
MPVVLRSLLGNFQSQEKEQVMAAVLVVLLELLKTLLAAVLAAVLAAEECHVSMEDGVGLAVAGQENQSTTWMPAVKNMIIVMADVATNVVPVI